MRWSGIAFLALTSGLAHSQGDRIAELRYTDPVLSQLRKEIFAHLRYSVSSRYVDRLKPLRFVHYTVKAKDNFFLIMAKTGQNHDTLLSVNDLVSVYALKPGQTIRIPNYRGIYVRLKPKETIRDFSYRFGGLVSLRVLLIVNQSQPDDRPQKIFVPNARLTEKDRRYFGLKGFLPPLKNIAITSHFGIRTDPFRHYRTFHGGVDLRGRPGEEVFAVQDGTVVFAGNRGGYGKLIIIDHGGGVESYYGHLQKIAVRPGQKIKRGKVIGLVGNTGRATGPHLHFEIRKKGRRLPPLRFIL